MTNITGGGEEYEIDFKEIINEIDAKIKLSEIKNEKKYVNESGDKITSLQITDEPKNDLDAVNLKYVKNLEIEMEKQNQIKTQIKTEIEKIKQVQQTIVQENEIFKNGVELLVKQIKRQIEKIKGDVARHTVNELRVQKESVEKIKTEIVKENEKMKTEINKEIKQENESYMKQFNLLNKNISKWYGEVENRFKKINLSLFNSDEEVMLKKIKEKIRKIKEKEPKKKFHLLFQKEHYKDKYGLNDKEFEIYNKWLNS